MASLRMTLLDLLNKSEQGADPNFLWVRFPSIPATPDQGQMVDWRIRWPQIGRR